MQLPDEYIVRFQRLYQKHFGVELSREEAIRKGTKLIRFMKAVREARAERQTKSP